MATQHQLDYADEPTDEPERGRSWLALVGRCFVYSVAWGFLLASVFVLPLLDGAPKLAEKVNLASTTLLQRVFDIADQWNTSWWGTPAFVTIVGLGVVAEMLWRRDLQRFWWLAFVVGVGCFVWFWFKNFGFI